MTMWKESANHFGSALRLQTDLADNQNAINVSSDYIPFHQRIPILLNDSIIIFIILIKYM